MTNLPLKIKGTEKTPTMEFDPRDSLITMVGVSVPENAEEFYTPILNWLDALINDPPDEEVKVEINLDYFSIHSSRILLRILKKLQLLPKVTIYWYYDDNDIFESGVEFSSILAKPLILREK